MSENLKNAAKNVLRRAAREENPQAGSTPKLRNWIATASFALPWFFVAALCTLAKWYLLENQNGFHVAAQYFGRTNVGARTGLTIWEQLTFFRSEILFELLLIPVFLLFLFDYLPRSLRAILIVLFSVGACLVLYIQFRAIEETGRFVSFELLMLALSWGWHDPGANKAYLLTKEFYVFLGCLICLGTFIWRASKTRNPPSLQSEHRWKTAIAGYLAAALLLAVFSWIPFLPSTAYHRNILWRSLRAFWHDDTLSNHEFEGRSVAELKDIYRQFTHAPAQNRDPRFFAKEKGANLIVIVLETTPARFLPADDSLANFPNLRRLQSHSIVAENQYTTYAYTNRALFSLCSSWYPSDSIKTFDEQYADLHLPGMIRSLAAAGYATAMFAPANWEGQHDQQMFLSLGFQKIVIPDWRRVTAQIPRNSSPDWKTYRVAQDQAALALMKQEIAGWVVNSRPFAAVFVPQVGHLPWPDNPAAGHNPSLIARGRAILAMQDAWLGELLELLDQNHQLNRTVIVVTGDHGIRTRREDPDFTGGTTDEYSFHVPLRLYAPNAIDQPMYISWLTSHIDVAPSVLDLLGIESGREDEQGSPVWNPEIVHRTTFLFGMQSFGADAYFSRGRYFMWSQMSGMVSVNSQLHFGLQDIAPRHSPDDREVPAAISRMVGFQQAWISQMGRDPSHRD